MGYEIVRGRRRSAGRRRPGHTTWSQNVGDPNKGASAKKGK